MAAKAVAFMSNNSIRILFLAPKAKELSDLPWVAREIDAVVNCGLSLRVERDDVTEKRLVELVASEQFGIIWFASHGTGDGIYLSDGLISSESLAAILRGSGVQYVVLNTCDSIRIADTIARETHADFICTVTNISDRDAWRTGALFARELAKGATVRDAYRIARPAKPGQYIYLPAFNGASDPAKITEKVKELSDAIQDGEIERIEKALTDLASLPGRVDRLEDRVTVIEARVNPPISSILALLVVLVTVIANVAVTWTIVTDVELRTVFAVRPYLAWGGEIGFVAFTVSWTWYAVVRWRAKGQGS